MQSKTDSSCCFGIKSKILRGVICLGTLLISITFLVAAVEKFLYPTYFFKLLEQSVSVFEVIFVICLFSLKKRWEMWMITSLLFFCWGGYSLFWYSVELPCQCMGALLPISTAFILILDGCLGGLALYFGRLLGANAEVQYFTLLIGLFLALCGFAFAEELYQQFVLAKPT